MAEYGKCLAGSEPYDYNANIHVGWNSDAAPAQYQDLFKDATVSFIQREVANYLMPLYEKPVLVPPHVVRQMITSVWDKEAGGDRADIYTAATFKLPEDEPGYDYQRIVRIVIQSITNQLKVEKEMENCNNKLNIWNTVLGDFNEAGLRAHPKIKLREKRPAAFQFHMHY